ncbi:septum formation family protein [Kineococcus sp. SYSU DK005]|uniref:septum formation family protein n=1 Tax=Kineococcus sp. SYSU DK005 TaxID=3383126 RepID=UPI003D7EA8D8
MRRAVLLAVLAALALLAGACAVPVADGSATGAQPATPTADVVPGTCKALTTAEGMTALSDVSPAVPCSRQHTAEAYAVVDLPADLAARAQRPSPEELRLRTGVCPVDGLRDYLGADDLDSHWGLNVFTKYPTRTEWADGLRRAACYLVLDRAPGTVPFRGSTLRGALRLDDSAELRLCRDDRGVVLYRGQDSSRAYVTCDREHSGELVGHVGASLATADQRDACRRLAERYVGEPLRAPWSAVVRSADGDSSCWAEHAGGPVRGTVRAGLVPWKAVS